MVECSHCQGTGLDLNYENNDMRNPLPVPGYTPQSQTNVDLVAKGKVLEERVLRYIEEVSAHLNSEFGVGGDPRFAAIGKTEIQNGFMMVYRSVFNPERIKLPEDGTSE